MADANVEVVVRAQDQGFEQLESKLKRAQDDLKRMGELTRAGGSTNSGPFGQMARQIDEATKKLQEFKREQDRIWNGRNMGAVMGRQWAEDMRKAMQQPVMLPPSYFRSITVGVANAVNAGWRQAGQKLKEDPYAAVALGAVAKEAVAKSLNTASDREQARLNLVGTGLVDNGRAGGPQATAIEGLSRDLSRKYGNLSTTDSLKFITDSLRIFGGTDEIFTDGGKGGAIRPEAAAMYNRLAGLMAFMKTYHGGDHAGSVANDMVQFANGLRSGELKGYSASPEKLADWVERLTRISIAQGVDPTAMLNAQRTAGSAFLALDDSAINTFAAYVQENKQRAGVQLMGFVQRLVGGGSQTTQSNEMLRKLGIISEDDIKNHPEAFKLNKQGEVVKVNDTSYYHGFQQAATNPWEWMAKEIYPGMRKLIQEKTGKDIGSIEKLVSERTPEEMASIFQQIGGTFGNRNTATFVTEGLVQYENLKKRGKVISRTEIDQAARQASYLGLMQTFQAQLDDFRTNMGLVFLPLATKIMPVINGALGGLADFIKGLDDKIGSFGALSVLGVAGWAGGGLALRALFASPILRTMALIGAGALGGGGILPYLLLGSVLKGGEAAGAAGLGIGEGLAAGGAAAGVGGAARGAARVGVIGRLSQWLVRIPLIGRALGLLGGISRLLFGLPGVAAWGVYEASKTQTGQDFWDFLKRSGKYAYHNLTGTATDKEKAERDASFKKFQDEWRDDLGLEPLDVVNARDKVRRARESLHYAHMYQYRWGKEAFAPPPTTFTGPRPAGRGAFSANGAARSGPTPVTIVSMPKGQDRPNNVTINNNINVTTNASGAEIAGAVGPATKAAATSALHDVHH